MTRYAPDQFPKRCHSCQAVYTEAEWQQLKNLGPSPKDAPTMEMRACPCKNTLAVELEDADV